MSLEMGALALNAFEWQLPPLQMSYVPVHFLSPPSHRLFPSQVLTTSPLALHSRALHLFPTEVIKCFHFKSKQTTNKRENSPFLGPRVPPALLPSPLSF